MKQTLHNYFDTKELEKIFPINAPIVDVFIEDILWDLKYIES